jgi:hypothetical protein
MKMKRAVMMAVLVIALVALALPIANMRSRAAGKATDVSASVPKALAGVTNMAQPVATTESISQELDRSQTQKISQELLDGMGMGQRVAGKKAKKQKTGELTTQSGTPLVLDARSPLSVALMTNIGGRDNQFSEVTVIADWDGREDCVADREQKIDDFSGIEVDIDQSLIRTGISEHIYANGFNENVYYYGDTLGNFWIGTDLNPGLNASPNGAIDTVTQVNIPALVNTGASGGVTLLNPQASDCTDDQVTVTGIAVNPVADLGDFGTALCGTIGEVVYVSVWDTEGCSSNAANQIFRTRIFAFGFVDVAGGVTSVGAIQILRNPLSNFAGVAVDDDGNLYFQLFDAIQFTGAAIFKITETPRTVAGCPTNPRINRVIASMPGGLTGTFGLNSWLGTTASPIPTVGGFRGTNYSGNSATFGNLVSITAGPCNVLYAAVAASFVPGAVSFEQLAQGPFTAPSAFASGTPSMVISFADCSGAFDSCTAPSPGGPGAAGTGTLPIADGIADVAQAGLTRTPGVNNFRIFALGNGPDIRPVVGGTSVVPGTPASVLKVDMQIDFALHGGISVNQEGTVFVISGGLPAGIGKNMSPMLGEILCFEDMCPMDRRGDFVDLRGNATPNPPASGGNVGDGDSDRFDHIWYVAPLDQVTFTPAGLAGLAGGHLLYTNRDRIRNTGTLANLPDGGTQGDDTTSGVLIFEDFDAGHQVAGGDDQNTPNRGDDNNGAGSPALVQNPLTGTGNLSGGFEFVFGATGVPNGTPACAPVVWNGFFLNSNGNITFSAGDASNTPTVPGFRSGLPRIAPAWADLNPAARAVNPINFPTQALGFANVNAFRVRWLNVPEFGKEGCSTNVFGIGGNTFGVTLYDDGTGVDENLNQVLQVADPIGQNDLDGGDGVLGFDQQEGPTDLRFVTEPNTGVLVGCNPRRNGSGHFIFDYCRTEMLGTAAAPVLTGYSIGGTSGLNPPGLCETNLSEVARAADNNPFGVINGQTASIQACLIGEGTEPHIFEFFNDGTGAGTGSGGEIVFATPDFDLRFEGNDAALCTPIRQRDLNRGKVGFFGVGCPLNPLCLLVTPVGTVTVAPNQPAVGSAAAGSQVNSSGVRQATATSGIINAVCNVQLNFLGCFFIPNEVTTICQGFSAETGVPLQRPGKTVTSALRLGCDTNGDGSFDSVTTLTGVNPLNINLVRGTLAAPGQTGFTGSAFPLSCCGGLASLTLTTTFTSGDNNIFGPFALTSNCVIDLGVRAPVVVSITPSSGDCSLPVNDLLISGGCFILPGFGANGVGSTNVTSVFAIEVGNPANVVQALRFVVLSPFLINADFAFTSANAGKTFLIFVSGPNGTSQNLTSLPAGTQGCPAGFLGNQLGIQVTFKCNSGTVPGGSGNPNAVTVQSATWDAQGRLQIVGTGIQQGAVFKIGNTTAKKVKYKGLQTGSNTFNKAVAKGLCPVGAVGAELQIIQSGVTSTYRLTQGCQQ